MALDWCPNDGGRAGSGFKGTTRDCVCRAISIASGKPYTEVYAALNEVAQDERRGTRKRGVSSARRGVYRATYHKYLLALGFEWTPTMRIGQGCKVHLREGEIPMRGRLVVSLSRHLVAVIDGTIHDTRDPGRDGTRCVYGFYTAPTDRAA